MINSGIGYGLAKADIFVRAQQLSTAKAETGGASLAHGMRNLMNAIRQGRLTMVDASAFAPGRNLALTPGKVVYRNKLIELIQYEPQTPSGHKTPLLILPPWINKYYIMDMQPKNSMVAFLVRQGFTVFMVSWKNPDAAMENTTIENYVELGPLQSEQRGPRDHRQRDGQRDGLLHRRHAAFDDARLAGRQG